MSSVIERLHTHNSVYQTEPNITNNKINFNIDNSLSEYNQYNQYNYTQVSQDDIEVIALRRQLNEIKKDRIKSENNVNLVKIKVNLLNKEEQKVKKTFILEIDNKTKLCRKKSNINKSKAEIIKSKIMMKEQFELQRQKLKTKKEQMINTFNRRRLESMNQKAIQAQNVYLEKNYLIEQKTQIQKEIQVIKIEKARLVRQSVDAALNKLKEKKAYMQEKAKRELVDKIKDELQIKNKTDKKINKLEKKQNNIIRMVDYMSPVVNKQLDFSS